MVDVATSIIRYKHISASFYSANSVSTIPFYHVLQQISIVLSHYVEIFLNLAYLGYRYLLGIADICQLTVTADGPLISSQAFQIAQLVVLQPRAVHQASVTVVSHLYLTRAILQVVV